MKIIDVNAHVVVPSYGSLRDNTSDWQWTFVTIDTDDGLQGWGEASNTPRNTSLLTGAGVRAVREALVGENPADIDRSASYPPRWRLPRILPKRAIS